MARSAYLGILECNPNDRSTVRSVGLGDGRDVHLHPTHCSVWVRSWILPHPHGKDARNGYSPLHPQHSDMLVSNLLVWNVAIVQAMFCVFAEQGSRIFIEFWCLVSLHVRMLSLEVDTIPRRPTGSWASAPIGQLYLKLGRNPCNLRPKPVFLSNT
jgi:hypothetical protein